ncbi:sugar ABC transporter permease [Bradyrhizobium brasilense]|uniref:ABC transporter permease n=1 Tax=Bradyrhizobium brasilense TaxID=1419277 RepID=UPI00097B6A1C|nr:ABC transporter permease [Bradyrhizobium brasilense]OMI00054.1 sugar ABC transporter permease [Bradyrhizobium brasilense]
MSYSLVQSGGQEAPVRQFLVRYGLVVLLVGLSAVFAWLRPSFVSLGNLSDLLQSAGIAAIMFLGLTWVLAAGEIDVSFVAVAALANMMVAGLVSAGVGWPLASMVALGASLLVGAVNGVLIAYLNLPALVTTIATGGIVAALAAAIGHGSSIALSSTGFVGAILATRIGIVPLITVIALSLYGGAWFLQERLVFGHYMYALAKNRNAVIEAGIPAARLLAILCMISSACSGLAGILLAAELSSGQPSIAGSYFLDGLTASLLGGVMLKLGKPNVVGTIFGVLILAVLVSGAALLGWTDTQRQIIKGLLLLVGITAMVWARPRM